MTSIPTTRRLRGALTAAAVVGALPLLLAGCSGTPAADAGTVPSAAASAPTTSAAATVRADPAKDLCAFLPKAELNEVMPAYDSPVATMASGTVDGSPSCTITGTDPSYVTVVSIKDEAFDDLAAAELGSGDAPPENGSVWLPKSKAYAATYGGMTVLVRGADDASGPTPTVIFVMGTVLDHLA